LPDLGSLVEKLEVPAQLRALFGLSGNGERVDMSAVNLAELTDGLPFPFLAALVDRRHLLCQRGCDVQEPAAGAELCLGARAL
jgi:hypothetical protein